MNNKHEENKAKLKKWGTLVLFIGIITTAIAIISFSISMSTFEPPRLFFFAFIGLPCIGIGSSLLSLGYKKEISSYIKNESVPVIKETYHDLKPEVNDLFYSIKNESKSIFCHNCNERNDLGASYCKKCGSQLEKVCPFCNSNIDANANYCPFCGKKIE